MNILIKNGRLVDPASDTDRKTDILIKNGLIHQVGDNLESSNGVDVIDAEGLVVSPGFIDIHVHLRDPGQEYKETIETGAKAAAAGGFTSICCMPNTNPVNDNVSTTKYMLVKAKEKAVVNVFPIAAVTLKSEGEELVNMEELHGAGVKAFSDDGHCVMNGELFQQALVISKSLGVLIMEHPEDHDMTGGGQINEGRVSEQLGLKGMPAAAEDSIVERDIGLMEEVGGRLHLTHLSTVGSLALVKAAREKGLSVTSDVTPHHLLLTEDVLIPEPNSMYKMKPPLRTEEDRKAMIEGIKIAMIDCIATDHAPHSREEKSREFSEAPYGVTGVETVFSVVYDRLVRTEIIDIKRLIELLSVNPAEVFDLTDRGKVAVGLPADLTLLDLEGEFKITANGFQSRSTNSSFIGWQGKGTIAHTIVGGKVVYSNPSSK